MKPQISMNETFSTNHLLDICATNTKVQPRKLKKTKLDQVIQIKNMVIVQTQQLN